MIGVSIALLISFLLLLLLAAWRQAVVTAREVPPQAALQPQGVDLPLEPCPAEYVSKIFSREDWEFVASMNSPALQRFFLAERKSLALLWVLQTAAGIQKVMRQHAEFSRGSADLEFATEMHLFFRYAELRVICAVLIVSIELVGPLSLRGLALHASKLSLRIEQAQETFFSAAGDAKGIRSSSSL